MTSTQRPPLISVITPTTTSRHAFHDTLYQSFRSQTYPHIELVVIDDMGPRSRVLSYSNDRRIQYIQAQRLTVGEKRNLALTMAKGSVVAHFDDDDFYGPEYLELMLSQLTRTCAQMITLSAWMWYDVACRKLARFDGLMDGDHSRLYGYGFSYMYLKQPVLALGFSAINFGEDYDLCRRAMEVGLVVRHVAFPPASPCVLHLLHGGNTSSCFATQQLPTSALPRLFGERGCRHLEMVREAICVRARASNQPHAKGLQ